MTQSSSPHSVRRGRVFPEKQLSSEEKARIDAEDSVFYKLCLTHKYRKGCDEYILVIKEREEFIQCNPGQKKNLSMPIYQINA